MKPTVPIAVIETRAARATARRRVGLSVAHSGPPCRWRDPHSLPGASLFANGHLPRHLSPVYGASWGATGEVGGARGDIPPPCRVLAGRRRAPRGRRARRCAAALAGTRVSA